MRTTWIALLGLGSCLVATAVTAAESPVYEHLKDLECFAGRSDRTGPLASRPAANVVSLVAILPGMTRQNDNSTATVADHLLAPPGQARW